MNQSSVIRSRILILVFVVLILTILLYVYSVLRSNFHTVVPGLMYRSAQMPIYRLKRLVEQDHIRTIINLRGANPSLHWYREEVSVSHSMGVKHYDVRLSSKHLPSVDQLQYLIYLFQTASTPILLHCEGGADRTGFAVALWLLMKGYSLKEAQRAASILYFVYRSDSIGKQLLNFYQIWLKQRHYRTSALHFMAWIHSQQFKKCVLSW